MGCEAANNNATAPSPGIAPPAGESPAGQDIDARRVAENLVTRFGPGGVDPRVTDLVPGFDGPFFQAGLAGYSDAPMRLIARRHGCPFCVTEALLDRTMLAGGRGFAKADLGELHENVPRGDEDTPLACQIMGSDPREMAAAALKAVEQGRRGDKGYRTMAYAGRDAAFARDVSSQHLRTAAGEQIGRVDMTTTDAAPPSLPSPVADCPSPDAGPGFAVIDVNLACPVKKVAKKARGGHWLAEPDGAIAILEAVRDAVPAEIPVTVKMRRSFDDTDEQRDNFFRVFDAAYDMGCSWVTVHGRTVEQKYVGPSRWDMLREIARRKHPGVHKDRIAFGSGDVWTAADVFRMIAYTGMQGASIARGCIGNPWVFRQCREMLAGRAPSSPMLEEQRAVLLEHFDLALAANAGMRHPELHTGKTMRKFAIQFSKHHPEPETVKRAFVRVKGLEEWRAVLDEHYASNTGAGSR
ncbi:MAG: tRNA-dihydrouridine synthase family protein [Planctomycetota bacterium]